MTTLDEQRRKLVSPSPDMPSLGRIMRASFTERAARPAAAPAQPPRPALLTLLARALGTLLGIVVATLRKGRTAGLSVAGLAFGVLAAFDYGGRPLGLASLFVACFVLEWLLRE